MEFANNAKAPHSETGSGVYGALRIPQALRLIANNHASTKQTEIILFGSALYDDPREAVFSMAGGLIPSDGHLNVSRAKSPYGAIDPPGLFNNMRIHFSVPDFHLQ